MNARLAAFQPTYALLRIAPFRRLLLAQAVSEIGDWMTTVALLLLVVRLLERR